MHRWFFPQRTPSPDTVAHRLDGRRRVGSRCWDVSNLRVFAALLKSVAEREDRPTLWAAALWPPVALAPHQRVRPNKPCPFLRGPKDLAADMGHSAWLSARAVPALVAQQRLCLLRVKYSRPSRKPSELPLLAGWPGRYSVRQSTGFAHQQANRQSD